MNSIIMRFFDRFKTTFYSFIYLVSTHSVLAQDAEQPSINPGDTAFVLICTALVFFMVPGLSFFYGGLVRKKNVLSLLMQCFIIVSLVSLQWVFIGYSLSFSDGETIKGFLGNLDFANLKGVDMEPRGTIPHILFMLFQAMFAIITPALIIGAIAERIRFSALCLFVLLWTTLVYDPICHWVWASGGFLFKMGALDFAGGTVVHINAGIAALIFAIYLGKRKGYPGKISPPHNLPFAVLGTGLLWFGWFGFNGGSQLAADGRAANAFVVTHIAAAAAALMWAILDWLINKKPTVLGVITGAVGGLVAITPASGFVNCNGAIIIGIGCSIICYFFVTVVKPKFKYDDSLDVFGVHGIGGIWGAIATGMLADAAIGGVAGSLSQTFIQLKAVAATILYTGIMTLIILLVVDLLIKLRVSDYDEKIGLDLSDHKESGYTLLE